MKYGIEIDKNILDLFEINKIKEFFTVIDDNDETLEKHFFYEDSRYLYIPHISHNVDFINEIFKKYNISISQNLEYYNSKFNSKMLIAPRNEIQKNTIDFLDKSMSSNKSLFLSPGTGKTALSIMYFVNKGLKPLIIVPDMNLVKQWYDSILEFTNISKEDVFIFEHGVSSFNKKDFSNTKRVYICCIKTLSSMISKLNITEDLKCLFNYIENMKIDIKIFDECHLNLHSIFKITTWFPTKENLFLSGTMNRRLFKENLIHPSIVEPNECVESVEYDIIPNLMAIFYNSNPNKGQVNYCQDFNPRSGFDYNRYFNRYLMSKKNTNKSEIYLNMIENICNYYNKDSKNKIIIVGYTIDFLDKLYSILSTKYRVKRMYSKYKEKPSDENFDIIIGTNKMLTAGFDHKSLNIMISTFMNTSKHNVKQLIGRICRSAPNKEFAQYICLVDSGFNMNLKYFKKHEEICKYELSQKETLNFKKIESKFKFE